MKVRELKLGKSIEIFVVRDEYKLRLISKIESVTDEAIEITLIEGNGKVFQFKETDEICFIYKDMNRLFKFQNVKGSIAKSEGNFVHVLTCSEDGESYNRRHAYRVFLGEENTFSWTGNGHEEILHEFKDRMKEAEGAELTKDCPCIIKDLSERGAGICTNERLQLTDFVSFEIYTSIGIIRCIGQVVRMSRESKGMYRNFYGIQFTEVSNIITKYVFAVQRLQLKNIRK